jgi:hypothetical protein
MCKNCVGLFSSSPSRGENAYFGISRDLISICIGDYAAATHLVRNGGADTKGFAKRLRAQHFSSETVLNGGTGKRNKRQVMCTRR